MKILSTIALIKDVNFIIGTILLVMYAYQIVYLVIGMMHRRREKASAAAHRHRYAAVVAARNESGVIADLIGSLRAQDYPQELLDIYVIADNCTDDTAQVAREAGALVYERWDHVHKGKGYALDYLFHRLEEEGKDNYEAFLIFDADNLVDPGFTREMNRVFDTGKYEAITCYRNSKNFGDNWISAGYAIWFLREARFLNLPRMLLGTNCHVSGTGFLVSARAIRENGGWPFHLLTEDIEFSISSAVQGYRIGYCGEAIVYDEQPTAFRQSWDQRLRWSKGFFQVDAHYTLPLIKGCTRLGRRGWSCYDMLMTVAPGMLLTLLCAAFNLVIGISCLSLPVYFARIILRLSTHYMLSAAAGFYFGLLLYGLLTVIYEWRSINAPAWKKVVYVFTFPLFMATYIPISICALLRRVEWKPIYHTTGSRQSRAVQ